MNAEAKKILIVDDQAGVRRLLVEMFKEDGYITLVAANGYEAVELVRKEPPDLVLLDMKMPGIDGVETLRQIREIDQEIKVVMMTAYGELELVQQSIALGAAEHITKPFDINSLREKIKSKL
jgi:two-component system response regulator (stage 0 sporulation protein F)